MWFRSTDFGDEKDRVVVRENGIKTYFASDIAYHFDKRERGFDHLIDILGADHHGYTARVRAGLEAMGYKGDDLEVELMQFVTLYRDGEKMQMSTRSGEFDTLRHRFSKCPESLQGVTNSDSDVCSESDDSAGGSWKNSPDHRTCTLGPFETDVTVQMSPKLVGGSSNTRRMKKQNRMSIKFGMAETLALRYAQLVSELTLVGRSRDGSPDGDDKLPGCDAAMVIAAGGPTGR